MNSVWNNIASRPLPQTEKDVLTVPYASIRDILLEQRVRFMRLEQSPQTQVSVNKNLRLEPDVDVYCNTHSIFTAGAFTYSNSPMSYGVYVGRYSSIGVGLNILGAHHYPDWISTSPVFYHSGYHSSTEDVSDAARRKRLIEIGHDVWVGSNVTLKSSVRIGNGAIIAANSVVTKDVDDFMVVGGAPAHIMRPRFSSELVHRINSVRWWRFHRHDLQFGNANHPHAFLDALEAKIADGGISEYNPAPITFEAIQASLENSHILK